MFLKAFKKNSYLILVFKYSDIVNKQLSVFDITKLNTSLYNVDFPDLNDNYHFLNCKIP